MCLRPVLLAALVLSCNGLCAANDLGVYGEIYPITEEDLLEQIQRRLGEMRASGELDRLEEEFVDRAKAKIVRPTPVPGIVHTVDPREWAYDPSWTAPQDIADQEGRIIIAAGQTINPLDVTAMRTPLLLIDGDDETQVEWATRQSMSAPWGVKIILVNGAPFELEQDLQEPVYFDQEGLITTKFGIRQVPAKVSQDGRMLRVEEVVP
ncbi:MAG: type-F conjugative transfer system protein TraW [Pseudomonadota bacterium]